MSQVHKTVAGLGAVVAFSVFLAGCSLMGGTTQPSPTPDSMVQDEDTMMQDESTPQESTDTMMQEDESMQKDTGDTMMEK